MRILQFKSQLTIAFFTAVNHLNGPLRKQKLYFNGVKRSRVVICDWWISIRFVCFCASRFVACDRYYDWRQWKTQLWRRILNFRVRMFVKSAVSREIHIVMDIRIVLGLVPTFFYFSVKLIKWCMLPILLTMWTTFKSFILRQNDNDNI